MSRIIPWLAVVGVDDGESMYSEDGSTSFTIQLKFPPSTLSPHSGRNCMYACVCSRSQAALGFANNCLSCNFLGKWKSAKVRQPML